MKKDLLNVIERLTAAGITAGIGYVVFTVFSRQPVVAENPLAVAVLTGICAVMPLVVLVGFGSNHDNGSRS